MCGGWVVYVFYYTCMEMECVFIAGNCVCMCLYMHWDGSHLECPCDWRGRRRRRRRAWPRTRLYSVWQCVSLCVCRCVCIWITPRVEKKLDSSSCLQLAQAERDLRIYPLQSKKIGYLSNFLWSWKPSPQSEISSAWMIQWRVHSHSQLWNLTLRGGFISSLKLKKKKKRIIELQFAPAENDTFF